MSLKIVSPAFAHGEFIPDKFTCTGNNVSPRLAWTDIPLGTKELVLIVDDLDAPSGTIVHWLPCHIRPVEIGLDEGLPGTEVSPNGTHQGLNGSQHVGYMGPCPPHRTHRYYFHLYAIDRGLDLPPGAHRDQVDQAMRGHVLEQAEIMGYHAKSKYLQSNDTCKQVDREGDRTSASKRER